MFYFLSLLIDCDDDRRPLTDDRIDFAVSGRSSAIIT